MFDDDGGGGGTLTALKDMVSYPLTCSIWSSGGAEGIVVSSYSPLLLARLSDTIWML
jgi:hypothetical protein